MRIISRGAIDRVIHKDGRAAAARAAAGTSRCGELSTGEYHAQYERSSSWVWTGGLEARQGVGTQDWGSPYTALKQNSKPSSTQRRVRSWGSAHRSTPSQTLCALILT